MSAAVNAATTELKTFFAGLSPGQEMRLKSGWPGLSKEPVWATVTKRETGAKGERWDLSLKWFGVHVASVFVEFNGKGNINMGEVTG